MNCPIIMVTGASAIEDELAGFDAGVDDYIRKPFDISVLTARIAVAARRVVLTNGPAVLSVGGLKLDAIAAYSEFHGKRLVLTPLEFRLLQTLMARIGRAVSPDELAVKVWGHQNRNESDTYRAHIRRLRLKLSAHGVPKCIHTIRGEGYCFSMSSLDGDDRDVYRRR
jgi:DNA-binding response OmpR family regulator